MKKDIENSINQQTTLVIPPSPFNTLQKPFDDVPITSDHSGNSDIKLSVIHYLISKEKCCLEITNTLNMLISNYEEIVAPFVMDFKIISLIINILEVVVTIKSKDIQDYCERYTQDFDRSEKTDLLLDNNEDVKPIKQRNELSTRERIEVSCQQLVSFIHVCLNNRELSDSVKRGDEILAIVRILTSRECEEDCYFTQKLALDLFGALLIKSDLALIDNLHRKKVILLLLDSLVGVTSEDNRTVTIVIEIIVSILKQTISISPMLYRDFNEGNGHQILQDALIACESLFDTDTESMKLTLKHFSDLMCIGERVVEPPQDYSQQLNITHTLNSMSDETRIKNIAIYQCLINIFLKATNNIIRQEVIEILLVVFANNGMNYPSVHHLHNMALLIRSLTDFSERMQQSVLKLVEYIFAGLNFAPLEELKMLGEILSLGETSPKLSLNVLILINKLLNFDSRFNVRFKEANLFDALTTILNDEFESILKAGEFNNKEERETALSKLLDVTIQVLITMLQKSNDNIRAFRESGGVGTLQKLLLNDYFRGSALKVFHTIIVQDTVQQSIDVAILVEILQTSKRSNIDLKIAIFNALTKMFRSNQRAKDSFRDAGFVASVSILINTPCPTSSILSKQLDMLLDDSVKKESIPDDEMYEPSDIIKLMQAMFTALAASMQNHPKNKLSFLPQIGENAIIDALTVNGVMNTDLRKDVFQCLIDFATERSLEEFDAASLATPLVSFNSVTSGNITNVERSTPTTPPPSKPTVDQYMNIGGLLVPRCPVLHNPFALLFCLKLLHFANEGLQLAVLQVAELMLKIGPLNLEGLSKIQIVDFVIDHLYDQMINSNHKFSPTLLNIVEKVACYRLSQLEWRKLLKIFADKEHPPCIMKLLLNAAKKGLSTPFVEIRPGSECPILNLSDKVLSSSMTSGYTFSCWVYGTNDVAASVQKRRKMNPLQRTQSNSRRTLSASNFGDVNVFILLNIQSDDGKGYLQFHIRPDGFLEFQNGTKSKRVLFGKYHFDHDKWHHITITHQRNRLSASVMSLYVDGKLEESQKVGFINPYTSGSKITGLLGKNFSDSIDVWRIGPSFLYEDVLYPEAVASIYVANNTYTGFFQGTYTPHMDLLTYHLYPNYIRLLQRTDNNKEISTETEAKENIIAVSSSKLYPEKLVFAFNALSHSLRSLDSQESRSNALFLESIHSEKKVPKILLSNLALTYVCCPTSLSDNILNSDGIVVVLALIDRAETNQALYDSLLLLYNIMMDSPLEMDEVERISGYDIIASFIRKKSMLLDSKILHLLFDFVLMGSGEQKEIVTNLKAFICLVIDYDIWRKTDLSIQMELFQRIVSLVSSSVYTHWNVIRLKTTGIVTKLLQILDESPAVQIVELIVKALHCLFKHRMSDNDMSSVCNYILNTLDDGTLLSGRLAKKSGSWVMVNQKSSSSFSLAPSSSTQDVSSVSRRVRRASGTTVSLTNIASRNLLMKVLYDLASTDENYMELFSKHVDERWFYQFVNEKANPISLILSLQLLSLLLLQGKIKPDSILPNLRKGLIPYCNQPDVYYTLALLMTRTIFSYPDTEVKSEKELRSPLDQISAMFTDKQVNTVDIVFCREVFTIMIELITHNYAPTSESALYGEVSAVQYFASFQSEEKSNEASRRWGIIRNVVGVPSGGMKPSGSETNLQVPEENSPVITSTIEAPPALLEERPRENVITKEILSLLKRIWRLSNECKAHFRKFETIQAWVNMIFALETTKKPKADVDNFLSNPMAISILSILRAVATYEFSTVSKGIQVVEDILRAVPVLGSSQTISSFRSVIITSLIKVYTNEKVVSWVQAKDSKLPGNIAQFCSFVVDMHYASILPQSYFTETLNFIVQVVSALKLVEVAANKMLSISTIFSNSASITKKEGAFISAMRALNRMILCSFIQVSSSEYTEKVLTTMLETKCFVTTLDTLNTDMEYFTSICFLLFTLMTDDADKVRDFSLKLWKLIVASQHESNTLTAIFNVVPNPKDPVGNARDQDIVEGFKSLLDSDVNIFMKWFALNHERITEFFNNNLSNTLTSYIEAENKRTQTVLSLLQTDTRLRAVSRSDRKLSENYGYLIGASKSQLKQINELEEERIQVLREESIIRLKFAIDTWNNLFELLFLERGIWAHKANREDNTLAWRLDSTEGPKRMRMKLEKFQLEKAYETAIQSNPNREQNSVNAKKAVNNDSLINMDDSTIEKVAMKIEEVKEDEKEPQPFKDQYEKFQEWSYLSPAKPMQGKMENVDTASPPTFDLGSPRSIQLDTNEISFDQSPKSLEIKRVKSMTEEDTIDEESENTHEGTTLDVVTADEVDDDDLLTLYEEEMGEDFKIRKLIEPGDMILSLYNCLRISGLDGQKSLFLICKNNCYIIDNYVITDDDKLIEVKGDHSTLIESNPEPLPADQDVSHETIKISLHDISDILKRRYLLRETAVEIFCNDGRNFFLAFNKPDMVKVHDKIKYSGSDQKHNKKAFPSLKNMQAKWQKGEVDNFEYLMYLNTLAGRSFNDLTQYPIFPWVLSDYSSEELNFNDPKIYRDLSKPMGGVDEQRAKMFRERYNFWCDPVIPKFHYGSHYSSAGIVLYYMLRIEPYTSQCVELQGGKFDIADRMFHSVKDTWESASSDFSLSDVKELIPEFYCFPEFLINKNNIQFGLRQNGKAVNEVELPPWAHGDPHYFVRMMRKALESDYVSEHLNEWVDLIFGHKQKGPEAEKALNVFFYLTYEGSVDIDRIADEVEKRAIIAQISNFGNTPQQLFTKPHPKRNTQADRQATLSPTDSATNETITAVATEQPVNDPLAGGVSMLAGQFNNLVGLAQQQPIMLPSYKKIIDTNLVCVSPAKLKGIIAEDVTYVNDAGVASELPTAIVAPTFTATLGKLTGKINKALAYKDNTATITSQMNTSSTLLTTPYAAASNILSEPITAQSWNPLAIGQIALTQKQLVNGIVATNKNCFFADSKNSKYYSYGHADYSLRLFRDGYGETPIYVHERLHTSQISYATIAKDYQTLVCGGEDSVVSVYKIKRHKKSETLEIQKRLCGHTDTISHVVVSTEFNIIVSGSYDSTCIVWDLSRLKYVRELQKSLDDSENKPISCISVCPTTGQIIVCSWTRITVYSINGEILVSTNLGRAPITTVMKAINPYDGTELLFTGHTNGDIEIMEMAYTIVPSEKEEEKPTKKLSLNKITTLKEHKSAVTSLFITPDGKKMYSGGEEGVVYKYTVSQ